MAGIRRSRIGVCVGLGDTSFAFLTAAAQVEVFRPKGLAFFFFSFSLRILALAFSFFRLAA